MGKYPEIQESHRIAVKNSVVAMVISIVGGLVMLFGGIVLLAETTKFFYVGPEWVKPVAIGMIVIGILITSILLVVVAVKAWRANDERDEQELAFVLNSWDTLVDQGREQNRQAP